MTVSAVALEALFDEGEDRFLEAVLNTAEAKPLRGLAERWYQDPRPPLRRMLLAYIDDGLLRPNHQPLAKRLYKLAEAASDHEAMAHVLVACDRMARRRIARQGRYDWSSRTYREWESVVPASGIPRTAPTRKLAPVNGRCPSPPDRRFTDPWTGERRTVSQSHLPTFTFRTRRYLARRAWRYFRTLAKQSPTGYRDAIVVALTLYEDQHLADPMQLLDAWGLVHALYHHHPALEPGRPGWIVKPGRALAELAPAPYLPEVWRDDPEPLFGLLVRARSRTVRLFALEQLRTHHAATLVRVPLDRVRRFLSSPHEEVMLFGAELFENAEGLEQLGVEEWRDLLGVLNPFATAAIVAAFERVVRPERLDDDALIAIARAPNAPAATLALRWLRARPVSTRPDLERRLALADAKADTVRADAAGWLGELLETSPLATTADVRALLDAHHRDVRTVSLRLISEVPKYAEDVSLWVAMSETPYDEVRGALLTHLDRAAGDLDKDALHRVWAAVLLAIHRGSRAKVRAARQLAERLVREPGRADDLLPLIAVSLRSLRRPERRTALAAVARAVFAHPALAEKVQSTLPGLTVGRAER